MHTAMRRFIPPLALFLTLQIARGEQPQPIVVCQYNVANYVSKTEPSENSRFGTRAKTEKSIEALIGIIQEINPDILGVCEMGSRERFADFIGRLNAAGLGYTDSEYVDAVDADRHLALVSRFPIVSRQSVLDVGYELEGRPEKVRRGFLDVTIQVNPEYQLRLVGVHLKSKLPIPQGEAIVRRFEAQKLRAHLDRILAADPETNLVCYGDFNDTKNEPMFSEITGARGSAGHMADLWARDHLGDRWTHYWRTADQYSRIDYLFVSAALFNEVIKPSARVYRGADWFEASDHRPVYSSIVPVNKPHKTFDAEADGNPEPAAR